MLTRTTEEIYDNVIKNGFVFAKVLVATLEHAKDERFATKMSTLDLIEKSAEKVGVSEKDIHETSKKFLIQLQKESTEQPIYTIHQFLRKGAIDTWTVTKMQVINSRLHYCDLRLKVLK